MNQHTWVAGCQRYYAENWLEPGNPEDGEWHDCHYPEPQCLGGTETVKLLAEHHAVQGVLQSEEYQRPCVWGWEVKHLSGELLVLGRKWLSVKARLGGAGWVARLEAMSPEEQKEWRERQAEHGRKGARNGARNGGEAWLARWNAMSPEAQKEWRERGREASRHQAQAVRIVRPGGAEEVVASQHEAARLLGCDRKTVRRALRRGGALMEPGERPGLWVPSGIRVERA